MSIHSFALNNIDLNNVIKVGTVFVQSTCKIPYSQHINRYELNYNTKYMYLSGHQHKLL